MPVSQLGSTFRSQLLPVGQAVYQNGATVALDIPRGLLLKRLRCRFSGAVTVATVNGTAVLSESALGPITRLEVTADGRKPFVSAQGRDFFRYTHFMRGKLPELVVPANPNTQTSTPISAYFDVDFGAARFVYPVDSYLDTRLYDNLQLKVTWGPGSTIITPGGGGTVTVDAGALLDVQAEYTAVGSKFVKFNRIMIAEDVPVVAVSSALRQPVPRNGLLAHTLVRSDIDSVLADSIINNITVRSQNTVYHFDHARWATLQAANVLEYQLDGGAAATRIVGYALLDYPEDYMMSSALDTTELNTLDYLFDVNLPAGTTRMIHLCHVFYEPVPR